MITEQPWEDELLDEKSLAEVFLSSKQIAMSPFNTGVRLFSFVCALVYIAVNMLWGADNSPILKSIERSAPVVFGSAATILGFLIAGFSIFASMASKSLFADLAKTKHKDTNLSELKYVFFNFINVFTVYLTLFVTAGVLTIVAPIGPYTPMDDLFSIGDGCILFINSVTLSLFTLLCVESALRLKSFIWSFYQSILIALILAPEPNGSQ